MKVSLLILILFPCIAISQNQFNIWYFGNKAGLDFNSGNLVAITNSSINTIEGCASIADSSGQLLFYTNGVTIWNKNHAVMANGNGLFGSISSAQSAIIVKQPGSSNIYYVFTTDVRLSPGFPNNGLNYSIVDMSLNAGLGGVTLKNKHLMDDSNEKLCAVSHANNKDVWIASTKSLTDSIYLFLLTGSGLVKKNTIINKGNFSNNGFPGQMKFSPDGRFLAYSNGASLTDSGKIFLLEFDNYNGTILNSKIINYIESCPYGLEFSPNGNYLYFSTILADQLYQIDVNAINSTIKYINFSTMIVKSPGNNRFGALQLGPDSRIYIANNLDSFLSVIEVPDSLNCQLKTDAVYLNGQISNVGLPGFNAFDILNSKYWLNDTFCIYDSAKITCKYIDVDSIQWDFGDGSTGFSINNSVVHIFNDSGNFIVRIKVFLQNGISTFTAINVRIEYIQNLPIKDTILCNGDTLILNLSHPSISSYLWQDGSQLPFNTFTKKGTYSVTIQNKYCKKTDSFNLSYGEKPAVFIGNDTVFCQKFSHLLNAGKSFKNYLWNTGQTTYSITVYQKGTYFVNVIDSNACKVSDTITLNQLNKPGISIAMDSINCQFVYLSTENINGNIYDWSNGDTALHTKVNKKGTYYLNTQNKYCKYKDTITINALPRPSVDLGPDRNLCGYAFLSTDETGQYMWSDGSNSASMFVTEPGLYWLTVTRNNCSASDSILLTPCEIKQYYVPTAFSPNNDQVNDLFKVYGNNIQSLEIQIFNRWGELIHIGTEWDGIYKNEVCMEGTYLYHILVIDTLGKKHLLNGVVSLIN
jgi:gliding motility-associated-like protein